MMRAGTPSTLLGSCVAGAKAHPAATQPREACVGAQTWLRQSLGRGQSHAISTHAGCLSCCAREMCVECVRPLAVARQGQTVHGYFTAAILAAEEHAPLSIGQSCPCFLIQLLSRPQRFWSGQCCPGLAHAETGDLGESPAATTGGCRHQRASNGARAAPGISPRLITYPNSRNCATSAAVRPRSAAPGGSYSTSAGRGSKTTADGVLSTGLLRFCPAAAAEQWRGQWQVSWRTSWLSRRCCCFLCRRCRVPAIARAKW